MTGEEEVKQCPFCGAKAEFSSGWYNDYSYARVDCTGCSAGVYTDSEREPEATLDELEKAVLADWNRRAEA